MRLQPGTFLQGDKYRIIDVLGQGGFGITYLAEQVMAERKVCIKEFFPKEYYKRDEDSHSISLGTQGSAEIMDLYKAKFVKEAKTIAKLDHPNIIHIFDVFTENNTAYYVMEYIEGESLSDVVKRNGSALAEGVAVDYIKQAASALGYIHERKIMHLDVKPANIMLRNEDGRPILIDFGLSKQYDAEGNQTSSTPVGISAGYAPMEQYQQGGVKEFSPETDIYSLGASLYYLVTGCVPPQAAAIVDDGLPELPAHLSSNVRNAIERSMEVQRKKRPHSMDEFVALLDDSKKVAPIIPTPQSESTVIAAASANIPDESTKLGETPAPSPKTEAPKKEWTPKYSTEKPKKSDDNKKKSRWWMWLLGLLLIGGGAYLILGANSGDNSDEKRSNAPREERDDNVQREDSANAELEVTATVEAAEAMAEIDNSEETRLAEEEAARQAEQQRLVEEEAERQRIAEQKKKEEAACKAEQQQKQAKKTNAPKEEEKLAIPNLQTDDTAVFEELTFYTEEESQVEDEDNIFTILEDPATFRGGDLLTFRNWVMSQLKYPQKAQENGIQGTVSISFVVDENGNVGHIKVLSSPDYILTEAVLNILHNSPKWKPGKQRGKPVKQAFYLPVSFKLQN